MDYILVKNGNVVGYPRPLPNSWEGVSNFNLLGQSEAKQYGWYPVRLVSQQMGPNDVVIGKTYVIKETEVLLQEQIRTLTQEEIDQNENQKWDSVRSQRNSMLSDCDWTMLSDSPLDEDAKAQWKEYRSSLRNIPQDFPDPESVSWPEPPKE